MIGKANETSKKKNIIKFTNIIITKNKKMQNPKPGSGLHNLGNTCFFNAVMQIILYTPALASEFQARSHSTACTKSDWCIFCAIQRLWHQSKKNRVVSPNGIVSNLRTVFKKFRLGRQEDSHQFLRYLVEGMQDAETGKLGKDREKNQQLISKTITYHTFGGRMRTFVLCLHCHHRSLTTQRYYDLSIQCQRSNTLLQGLESYFRVDDLTGSNKYKCDSCKQLVNAKKGFKIISIPSVITFQLKRFTNNLRKIGKVVEYPRTINLNRYMDSEQQLQKTKLDLYGVIVHSGSSAGSGHYFAFVKNGSQWFEMNDGNVSRCNEERVLRQQAYLLFYAKTGLEHQEQHRRDRLMEEMDILTNVRESNKEENKAKVNGNHQKVEEGSKQKQKEKPRKKSVEMKKVRKLSEEQFEQIKRKLSMDIEELKQEARMEAQEKNQATQIQLNRKSITAPIFGQVLPNGDHKNGNKKEKKQAQPQNKVQAQPDSSSEQQIEIPNKLQRRRSKEQALSSLSIMQMILAYGDKIADLQHKLPKRNRGGHRGLRSVYNLRKFELASKRRKIVNG